MIRLGVDFGGTRIKAGLVQDGRVLRVAERDTPAESGPRAVLERICEAVFELEPRPTRVGVAIPGEVDASGRCWRLPNVPGFEGYPLGPELAALLGARIVIENDASSAALGELHHGHGRSQPSFLLMTLGTGIGGGLVVHRNLVRGANGFGAEVGHLRIDTAADAPACVCGYRGCVEAFAGTRALLARYAELGGRASEVVEIARAASAAEPAALEVFRGMGAALGRCLAQIQRLLDLDAIVFSGGISRSFSLIEPSLREALIENAYSPPLGSVPLLVSQMGEHAGIVGAALLGALETVTS